MLYLCFAVFIMLAEFITILVLISDRSSFLKEKIDADTLYRTTNEKYVNLSKEYQTLKNKNIKDLENNLKLKQKENLLNILILLMITSSSNKKEFVGKQELINLGMESVFDYVEDGVTKFEDFAKIMISELGNDIRPYLKTFYNAARDFPGMEKYASKMNQYSFVRGFDVERIGKVSSAEEKKEFKSVVLTKNQQEELQSRLDQYFDKVPDILKKVDKRRYIGRTFERYVAYHYFSSGYNVETNYVKGKQDEGIDLIARKGRTVFLIQCKYWRDEKRVTKKLIDKLQETQKNYKNKFKDSSKIVMVLCITKQVGKDSSKYAGFKDIMILDNIKMPKFYPSIKCDFKKKTFYMPFDENYDEVNLYHENIFMLENMNQVGIYLFYPSRTAGVINKALITYDFKGDYPSKDAKIEIPFGEDSKEIMKERFEFDEQDEFDFFREEEEPDYSFLFDDVKENEKIRQEGVF